MQHPLATKSLAPYGFVFPRYVNRLNFEPEPSGGGFNAEKVIAKQWARVHRIDAPEPTPIEVIIHRILPGRGTLQGRFKPDFEFKGRPYSSRDIALLSTAIQWLGTNVGNGFLLDAYKAKGTRPDKAFSEKFAQKQLGYDMVMHFTHVCTEHCRDGFTGIIVLIDPCYLDPSQVTERDRVVVEGLMLWLGRKAGRAFLAEHFARYERAGLAARERARKLREESTQVA